MKLGKIRSHLDFTRGQIGLIVGLVCALEFLLNLWMLRVEYPADTGVYIQFMGLPFEAVKITSIVGTSGVYPNNVGFFIHVNQYYDLLWIGIITNLIIYIFLSAVLVKLATWIRDEMEYRRYCSLNHTNHSHT